MHTNQLTTKLHYLNSIQTVSCLIDLMESMDIFFLESYCDYLLIYSDYKKTPYLNDAVVRYGSIPIPVGRYGEIPFAETALLERMLCLAPVVEIPRQVDFLRAGRPFTTDNSPIRGDIDSVMFVASAKHIHASLILVNILHHGREACIPAVQTTQSIKQSINESLDDQLFCPSSSQSRAVIIKPV